MTNLMPLVIIIATLLIIYVFFAYRKDIFFSGKIICSIILVVFLYSCATESGNIGLAMPSLASAFIIARVVFKIKIKGMI